MPSELHPPSDQRPSSAPFRPLASPHPTQTAAQAHRRAGALQAGQAEHQESRQQRHVPVVDGKPLFPPRPHTRVASHPRIHRQAKS